MLNVCTGTDELDGLLNKFSRSSTVSLRGSVMKVKVLKTVIASLFLGVAVSTALLFGQLADILNYYSPCTTLPFFVATIPIPIVMSFIFVHGKHG